MSDIALILNPGRVTSRSNRGITKIGKEQQEMCFQVGMPVIIISGLGTPAGASGHQSEEGDDVKS